MRAAHLTELGGTPTPVEILDADGLEVVAVALNPLDLAVGSGRFYGGHPPLPYVPGCEAVARTADGGLVYVFGDGRGIAKDGFLAERVAVPDDCLLRLPDDAEPELAAVAGIAGIAAWVPIVWRARVGRGDRVLVLGGTGTVGRIAARAAELAGAAHVVAVGSADLDRIPEEFGDDGFTVCIDPVWGEPLAKALQYAQRHARIVHLGQSAGPESPLRSADVRGKELTIVGHSNFALSASERERAYREVLAELSSGRIEVDYDVFGLDDVAAAWENQRGGKSVVIV